MKENKGLVTISGLVAGVVGGLGIGAGVLLVPLFRKLGLSQTQASSTSAFTVFIVSGVNVVQAFFYGQLGMIQFLVFFGVSFLGSLLISVFLNQRLIKTHRASMLEMTLFILTGVVSLALAFSLWYKVQVEGGKTSFIFGFGSVC